MVVKNGKFIRASHFVLNVKKWWTLLQNCVNLCVLVILYMNLIGNNMDCFKREDG